MKVTLEMIWNLFPRNTKVNLFNDRKWPLRDKAYTVGTDEVPEQYKSCKVIHIVALDESLAVLIDTTERERERER